METVWRVILSWKFYGKIILEIVWVLYGRKNDKSNQLTVSVLILP